MNNAIINKNVGLWMDHSIAHFITFKKRGPVIIETIHSPFISHLRVEGEGTTKTRFTSFVVSNNEKREHNREIEKIHDFYKDIEERLALYDNIYIFGPTTAKTELLHQLEENNIFKSKKIKLEDSDKMTDNQMIAKVKKYFIP